MGETASFTKEGFPPYRISLSTFWNDYNALKLVAHFKMKKAMWQHDFFEECINQCNSDFYLEFERVSFEMELRKSLLVFAFFMRPIRNSVTSGVSRRSSPRLRSQIFLR